MALMHCCFYSPSLGSNTSMNVIIPTIQGGEQINDTQVQAKYNYEKGLPVAILLHGAYGNADSWIRNSNVERYAQARGLAVVMVSAENSFYQNMVHGHPYKSFIIDEVLPLVQNLYPVSKRPEDTFIGGFSMGGYGAWYLGMSAPDKFSKAASMSGALDLPAMVAMGDRPGGPAIWENIFGAQRNIADTESDLMYLYDRCVKNGKVPSLYQSCGTEDFLYPTNVAMRDCLQAKGADLFYSEGTGYHDWDFWDDRIKEMFDWMLGMK